jgi:hypothetical protein
MSDEYARKYMGGDRIRFLDKVRMPRWFGPLLLAAATAGAVGAISDGSPEAMLAFVPVTVATWALLSTIRVSVTDAFVHVQYGLWGPKVALDDVVAVEVIEYRPTRFGGWGIRMGLRGERAYSMPGAGGRAVQLRYRTKSGERVAVITSAQPDALAQAIADAQAARARSLAEVRDGLAVKAAPMAQAAPQADEAQPKEAALDLAHRP